MSSSVNTRKTGKEFRLSGCDKLIEVKKIRYQEVRRWRILSRIHYETIQILSRDSVKILRKAAIYAQRIDWFLSGDDGEDNLEEERLEEELKKLEKEE